MLTVNDLEKVGGFYQDSIGLRLSGDRAGNGAGSTTAPAGAAPRRSPPPARTRRAVPPPFCCPTDRAGKLAAFAADGGLRLDGASDHLVSEAVYLHDPEGNGIEIYADRPARPGARNGAEVRMDTVALDVQGLLAAGDGPWQGRAHKGPSSGMCICKSATWPGRGVYMNRLGMDRTAHVFGASFFASGGYHHHLAGNIWKAAAPWSRSADAASLSRWCWRPIRR